MAAKLDQSLDEILSTRRGTSGRGGARRRAPAAGRTAGPAGGVRKPTKAAKPATIPTGPLGGDSISSRIQVSNLPRDVMEHQVKEYFLKSVGPIKKVEIAYGPKGESRGVATITFVRPDAARKASKLDGLLVDGKPIKIAVLLDAARAANIPAPKGLSERITLPKSQQPKSATTTKAAGTPTTGGSRGGKNARGRGGKAAPRSARPAKKTAEELDSEMADYWESGATAGTEGATTAAAPPAGDATMDDEIL